MGGQSILGLLFEISADPSKAKESLAQFEAATGQTFQRAGASTRPLNDSLLSSRESVRLLSEEMGVHLPRAVSSAISEIIPNIAMMGTALLGVFAVEEVVKFGKELKVLVDDYNEVARAAKVMAEIGKENEAAMERAAKASRDYARTQIAILAGNVATAEQNVEKLKQVQHFQEAWGMGLAVIVRKVTGETKDLADAESEVIRLQQLHDSIVNILGQDEVKASEDSAKAAKKHAEEVKRLAEELNRFNQEEIKEGVAAEKRWAHIQAQDQGELEKALKETNKAVDQQGRGFVGMAAIFAPLNAGYQQLTAAQRAALPTLREEQLLYREITKLFPDMEQGEAKLKAQELARNATVRQLVENTKQHKVAQKELNEVIYESIAGGKLYGSILDQLRAASIKETDAIKQNTLAGVLELSTGVAGLIAGRKGQAAMEVIWETARGIACLAEGAWPPNPAAIIAAGLHFEAAAQYGIMGGGGGGSRSAGGGSASVGGNQSDYGRGSGAGGSSPGGGPGQPGRGPTIILNTYGPVVGTWADAGKAMANVLNQLARTGQVKLVATTALTNGPKIT